jgi:Fe-S cluster biogenesis protein NfuA
MKEENKKKKIDEALDEIRPFLQKDGGDIHLVSLNDDEVVVKFEGNCYHCKINNLTLRIGVTKIIQKHLPEIKIVRNID